MTDLERLLARTQSVLCVKETTTKSIYYNCFGDKIDEKTDTTAEFYTYKSESGWIKGKGEE